MTPEAEAIGNPWVTIWSSPRATIRRVVFVNPRHQVIAIAALSGALSALEARWSQPPPSGNGAIVAWPVVVVFSVVLWAILSIVWLYIVGGLFKWAGAALGGTATQLEVRAAVAWAQVPVIAALAIGILSILLGTGAPMVPFGGAQHGTSASVSLLHGIFGIWSFILTLKCVAEVHRFSVWRALGALLLIVVGIAAALIVLLFALGGLGRIIHPMYTI